MPIDSIVAIGGFLIVGKMLADMIYVPAKYESQDNQYPKEWLDKICAVPTMPIAEIRDGMRVRIVGKARTATPLEAPLSKRSCAFYEVRMSGRVSMDTEHNKPMQYSVENIEMRDGAEFYVDDGTGLAVLYPGEIETLVNADYAVDPILSKAELLAFLERENGARAAERMQSIYYCREGIIAPEERVAVVGRAQWEVAPCALPNVAAENYRSGTRVLRLRGTVGEPLLFTDYLVAVNS